MNNRWPNISNRASRINRAPISGVNQTIADALSLVLARPWLMLVPLVLDLVLLTTWQITSKPLANWLAREISGTGSEDASLVVDEVNAFGDRAHVNDLAAAMVPSLFGGLPKDTLVSLVVTFFAPALSRGVDRAQLANEFGDGLLSTLTPPNGLAVVMLACLFIASSTVISVLFRVPIARSIRRDPWSFGGLVADCLKSWWRLALLTGLFFAGVLIVLFPAMLILGALYLAGLNLVVLVMLGIVALGSLAAMYSFFAVDAIVLHRAGPLQSIALSYAVVRSHFRVTVRFVAVWVLIGTGALRVLEAVIDNMPGLVFALAVNAFLGTGLAVASMSFYRDRALLLDRESIVRARTVGKRWLR